MRKNIYRITYLTSILLMGITVSFGLYTAHYLRPAADDYCYGSITAEFGFLGGMFNWFDTWSGFVLSVFTGSVFVGVPLAYLPFDFASAIPFIAAALGMGVTINFLSGDISNSFSEKLINIILVVFGWWTFLWGSPTFSHHLKYSALLANGLTFWQTLNGQYVIQLQILIALTALSLRSFKSSVILSLVSGSIIGLMAGSAGTTLSLSILVIGLWFIASMRFLIANTPSEQTYFWYSLCICLLASAVACHFLFQGNIIRAKALNINVDISWSSLFLMSKITFLVGLKNWVKSYLNHGALLFFLLTSGFYWLRGFHLHPPKAKKILALAFLFLIFSLVQCFVNRLSEFFSYEGYWHYVSPMVCSFISLYFFGVWSALILISLKIKKSYTQVMLSLFVVTIILSIIANFFMFNKIRHRHDQWIAGAAPGAGISDIEDGNGWQNKCWTKLITIREQVNPRLNNYK